MRVATYNIAAGQYCNQELYKMREQFERYQIDLIGVQEVDQCTRRSGQIDQIEALKRSDQEFVKFDKAIDFGGGAYGLGMISKYPVIASSCQQLDSKHYEQRIIQKCTLQIGREQVSFYNTHLSFEDSVVRMSQLDTLKKLLDQDPAGFKVVTGDFNISSTKEWELFQLDYQLVNGYQEIWHDTFPGEDCGTHQLDQIILSKNFKIEQVELVKTDYSDHYMLWTEVTYNKNQEIAS